MKAVTRTTKTEAAETTEVTETVVENNVQDSKLSVKLIGNAAIITSSLKYELIKKLKKIHNAVLALGQTDRNGDFVELFRLDVGPKSSFTKFGIVFATEDKNGYATVTVLIPEKVKDKKEWFKENYTQELLYMQALEAEIHKDYTRIMKTYEALDEIISEE